MTDTIAELRELLAECSSQDKEQREMAHDALSCYQAYLPALLDRVEAGEKALQLISENTTEVYDEDLECLVYVSCDAEELAEIARIALQQKADTP